MASVDERTPKADGRRSRPPALPLVVDAQELGLPLDKLRTFLETESRHGDPLYVPGAPGQIGFYDPPIGRMFGKRLAARMESLLSRPGCRFVNSYMYQAPHGARLHAHLDRPPLDVTMSVPVVCEDADGWPLWVEQPDGGRFEWAGTPGTVLIVDGRWRLHGRDAFEGTRSVVLLLHWTAPAVLWPGFLDEDALGGWARQDGGLDPGSAIVRRCSDLARLAVPYSIEPERTVVCHGPDGGVPEVAAHAKPGAEFLVLLDGKATVTFDEPDGVGLQPGDGIAFLAGTKWRIRWRGRDAGRVIFGRSTLGKGHPARRRWLDARAGSVQPGAGEKCGPGGRVSGTSDRLHRTPWTRSA